MPSSVNGSTGGGGASAPAGTGVVTATGGAFVDPVPSASTTRATLGLGSLATASSVTASQVSDSTTAGRALLTGADASAQRTSLELGSLATASTVTASQVSDSTTAGRALLTGADAVAQRTSLGLGGAAVLAVGTTAGTVAAGDALSSAGLSTTPAVGQTAADGNLRTITPNATGSATTNGNGTASANSTTVTLSLDGSTLATWYSGTYNAPRVTVTPQSSWTAPAISPHRMQAQARIATRTGSGASFTNTVAILGLDGGAAYRYGVYAKVSTVGSENESSAGAAGIVSTTGAGLAWDGNDWMRIRVEGSQITFYFGRGSGSAVPAETAWVAIGSTTYTVAANFAGFAVVLVLVQSASPTGGAGPTITFDNITVRRLP